MEIRAFQNLPDVAICGNGCRCRIAAFKIQGNSKLCECAFHVHVHTVKCFNGLVARVSRITLKVGCLKELFLVMRDYIRVH